MNLNHKLSSLALFVAAITALVRADSLSPSSISATINQGNSITFTKVFTVDASPPNLNFIFEPNFADSLSLGASSPFVSLDAASNSQYSLVSLDLGEVPTNVFAVNTPAFFSGLYDRTVTRTFEFDLTFQGASPGVYDFNIYGLVDGARTATESDHIVVLGNGGGVVPEASTYGIFSAIGLLTLVIRRHIRKKTA